VSAVYTGVYSKNGRRLWRRSPRECFSARDYLLSLKRRKNVARRWVCIIPCFLICPCAQCYPTSALRGCTR
jgi:hypothetical protein